MQQPVYQLPQSEKSRHKRNVASRIVSKCFMLVGAGATLYVLIRLAVLLLVELKK